jgi:hypothetical protein
MRTREVTKLVPKMRDPFRSRIVDRIFTSSTPEQFFYRTIGARITVRSTAVGLDSFNGPVQLSWTSWLLLEVTVAGATSLGVVFIEPDEIRCH